MKDIKLLVATHKKYKMPKDKLYLPIHVGKVNKSGIGFIGDDTGDNISIKNPYYCELTAIYWAWKNIDADYIGLVHYRRHFTCNRKKDKWDSVLTLAQATKLLKNNDIILPEKRRYFIETIYSHYANTHDHSHLDFLRNIIEEHTPQYLSSFDKVMKSTSAHMFNMFIMKKELFHSYCQWLFPVLEKLEQAISIENLPGFEARLFGRVSEFLLDVWIDENELSYTETGYVHMEKINWVKKIKNFIFAKIADKKYNSSL